jgi:hypothetical protein
MSARSPTIDATFAAIDSWRSSSLGKAWPRYTSIVCSSSPANEPAGVYAAQGPIALEIFTVVRHNKGNSTTPEPLPILADARCIAKILNTYVV